MRTSDIEFSVTLRFPCDRPDENMYCYTRDAIEQALKNINEDLPVSMADSCAEKKVGKLTSGAYAVHFDEESQSMVCNIDGVFFHGGTSCTVNEQDTEGNITDFTIDSIGISLV